MTTRLAGCVLLAALASGGCADPFKTPATTPLLTTCTSTSEPTHEIPNEALQPGVYEIVLKVDTLYRYGAWAAGTLTLVKSTPDDVSPKTHERVTEDRPTYLRGALMADLARIGRENFVREMDPPAWSTDPIRPGVSVRERTDWRGKNAALVPTFSIGTSDNIRLKTSMTMNDGPAMYGYVFGVTPSGFRGAWEDGSNLRLKTRGYFCAELRR